MEKNYPLTIELVPDECWYSNLRSALPKDVWDKIRIAAYKKANGRCEICGVTTSKLEAHEIWDYDEEKKIQRLIGITALCKNCHEVKHIARTQLIGRGKEAEEHFKKVNRCSESDLHLALAEANKLNQRRNRINGWITDINILKDILK